MKPQFPYCLLTDVATVHAQATVVNDALKFKIAVQTKELKRHEAGIAAPQKPATANEQAPVVKEEVNAVNERKKDDVSSSYYQTIVGLAIGIYRALVHYSCLVLSFCSQHIGSLFSFNASFGNGQTGVGSNALSNNNEARRVVKPKAVQNGGVLGDDLPQIPPI